MIKIGDLETGDRRGWEGQGRGGDLHAASLLGQTFLFPVLLRLPGSQ